MNFLKKIILKANSTELYKDQLFLEKVGELKMNNAVCNNQGVSFKHSGNAGDLIYSLPCLISLAKDKTATLFLNIDRPANYGKNVHPLGNVMLNDKMVKMLEPLLTHQSYISKVSIFSPHDGIDYDLDLFREYPLQINRTNLSHLYFLVFGVSHSLCDPWLTSNEDKQFNDSIIIARSKRYRSPGIDYSFLKKYKKLYFLGVEDEYIDIKQQLPDIQYIKVKNFLEMASIIKGSRLFIGNQSFPFSLAEAMKVDRILEVYFQSPNVSVIGGDASCFCFQHQFEKIVSNYMEKN